MLLFPMYATCIWADWLNTPKPWQNAILWFNIIQWPDESNTSPPNRQPLTSVTTSEESQILEVTGVQKLYLLIQVDLAGRAVLELADYVPTSSDPKARGLVSTAAHTALLDGLCSDSACFIYSLYTLMFVTQEGFSNYKLLPHFATGTPNTLDLICQSSSRNLPGAEHLSEFSVLASIFLLCSASCIL